MGLIRRPAWRPRAPVLAPAGLVAAGPVVPALLRALAPRAEAPGAALRLVAGGDLACVLGPTDVLPWVDGVRYCAPDPLAPGLWLPTTQAPDLPPDLVLAALERRAGPGMLLFWPDPELILPLAEAQPVTAGLLAWLDREFA